MALKNQKSVQNCGRGGRRLIIIREHYVDCSLGVGHGHEYGVETDPGAVGQAHGLAGGVGEAVHEGEVGHGHDDRVGSGPGAVGAAHEIGRAHV